MLADVSAAASAKLVATGLGECIVYPHETRYDELVTPHWSHAARLTPHCVVLPQTTDQVANAVATLARIDGCIFAIRSGGHTMWPGASNHEDGIVIDLSRLNKTTYNKQTKIASIQTGARWGSVNSTLEPYGVTVGGGRLADVGVGGFLLGGGFSWYVPRYGFGCDNVVNYEVILADGRTIQANKNDNADLFLALKGGGNNFGVVTCFDMETIEGTDIWGGMNICAGSTTEKQIEYFVEYVDTIEEKLDTFYAIVWTWNAATKDTNVIDMICNTEAVANPPALEKVLSLPSLVSTTQKRGVSELGTHLVLPESYHNCWLSLTFKNDPRVLSKAAELHDICVEKLRARIPDGDFSTLCFAQGLPTLYAKRSQERGGNVLGLENLGENCISLLVAGHIKDKDHVDYGYRVVRDWYDGVLHYAKGLGLWKDWIYLNYADGSQSPLSTIGEANIRTIREAALKYDPHGVFQTKCPGGFKVTQI